jgi:hypothetical protein
VGRRASCVFRSCVSHHGSTMSEVAPFCERRAYDLLIVHRIKDR